MFVQNLLSLFLFELLEWQTKHLNKYIEKDI